MKAGDRMVARFLQSSHASALIMRAPKDMFAFMAEACSCVSALPLQEQRPVPLSAHLRPK